MSKSKPTVPPTKAMKIDPPAASSKLAGVVALLRRLEGARLDEMQTATGWQAHSVRGAMSGAIKKKMGLDITSEKTDAGRVYRIVQGQA